MKIFTSTQIKQADDYTIQFEPIASIDLMERASRAFTRSFQRLVGPTRLVNIIAGTGNNGGDGLAIARMLLDEGYQVDIYVVNPENKDGSKDFNINLSRLDERQESYTIIRTEAQLPEFPSDCVIIDAMFGNGLSRPLTGLYAEVVESLNRSKAQVIAVDIASGLFADQQTPKTAPKVFVDVTFTFQFPKLAFFFPGNVLYVGDWSVLEIGLHPDFIRGENTNYLSVEADLVRGWIPKRPRHAHKGTFGRALLVAGSFGKIGAAILSCRACLRSGVGLLTTHIPSCGYTAMQAAVPEVMVSTESSEHFVTDTPDLAGYTAVGVGPGLGREPETVNVLEEILTKATGPVVLDADALNILADNRQLLELIPTHSILTPHPKELSRLTGDEQRGWEQLETARAFARRYGIILVLKGAYTTINLPDGRTYFNTSGNPGMATAGSGDVLTGVILGLLAQGILPAQAALLGVFLHGLAGNICTEKNGFAALIASDIIEMMGQAFLSLANPERTASE